MKKISKIWNNKNIDKYSLIFLIIIFSVVILSFAFKTKLLLWDEVVYLSNARSHIMTSNYLEDFRFPLLEYVIASGWAIFGESVFLAQIIMVFFSILSIYGIFLIGKIYDKSVPGRKYSGILMAVLLSLSPIFIFWSYRIYTDIPAMCCMIFAYFFYIKNLNTNKTYFIFLSGALSTLAFLFRFPIIIFAVVIFGHLVFQKKWKSIYYYLLGGFIFALPWLVYNYIHYKNPLWDLIEQQKIVAMYTSGYKEPFLKQLLNYAIHFNIAIIFLIAGVFSLFGKVLSRFKFSTFSLNKIKYENLLDNNSNANTNNSNYITKNKSQEVYWFYILSSSFIIFLINFIYYGFFTNMKLDRYLLAILPFVIIFIFEGIIFMSTVIYSVYKRIISTRVRLKQSFIQLVLFIFVFTISIISAILIINDMNNAIALDKDQSLLGAISFAEKEISSSDVIISNNWVYFGYYGNHKSFSNYHDDLRIELLETNAGWIIITELVGLDFSKAQSENIDSMLKNGELNKLTEFEGSLGKTTIYKVISID